MAIHALGVGSPLRRLRCVVSCGTDVVSMRVTVNGDVLGKLFAVGGWAD